MDKPGPESMKALECLQSMDLKIALLEKQKETPPPELIDLKQKMNALEREIAGLEEEIKTFSRERREKESLLEEKLQVLAKLRSQKNLVTTNEAYTALLKEIEEAEREQKRVEEDIITYMEQAEELAGLAGDKRSALEAFASEMKVLEEKNRVRVEGIEKQLAELYGERRNVEEQLDFGLLAVYEKVREAKGGLALVSVSREGVCQGCFMELRLHTISELMKGELITCDGCSRLLYKKDE